MPTITTVKTNWETGVDNPADVLRRAESAAFLGDGSANGVRGGVVYHGPASFAVSVNGSDQVTVGPGIAVIPAATGLGVYRNSLQSATAATAIDARNATNPRIDVVVMRSSGAVDIITGTPGSSPSAPTFTGAVELARLNVPANGAGPVTVDNSFRTYATALGGTLFVATKARLPVSGVMPRQRAITVDTGREYVWDAANSMWHGDWVNLTLSSPWSVSGGETAQILRDSSDTVHLRGLVAGGTNADPIAGGANALPAAYRPTGPAVVRRPVQTGSSSSVMLSVTTAGVLALNLYSGSATVFDLGCSYSVR